MSREEFWRWNIETKAYHWYGKYKYSDKLHNDLLAMDSFTKNNNIKLTFIIVPHNREFHNWLVEFGLSKDENNFKTIMANLNATVIDYDYENVITTNKNNFSDPLHYNYKVGHLIVNEVFKDSLIIGRKLKKKRYNWEVTIQGFLANKSVGFLVIIPAKVSHCSGVK